MRRRSKTLYANALGIVAIFSLSTFIIYFLSAPARSSHEVSLVRHFSSIESKTSPVVSTTKAYRSRPTRLPVQLVANIVEEAVKRELSALNLTGFEDDIGYHQLVSQLVEETKTNVTGVRTLEKALVIAERYVSPTEVLPRAAPFLGQITRALQRLPIIVVDVGKRGTQLKLQLTLDGGHEVVLKPMFYERDAIMVGEPYSGADRHNGEIVAFHLSRILDFRLTPIAVGRRFHLKKDILSVSTDAVRKTFFRRNYKWLIEPRQSPDNRTCFYGKCHYCSPKTAVCSDTSGYLETALVLWLPKHFPLAVHRHPWQRTYKNGTLARWETDVQYCDRIRARNAIFTRGRRMLDLIDAAILDFLAGNADRHHYETFADFPDAAVVMLDNGKSFGDPGRDEMSILAPLYQCCKIRRKTYEQLVRLRGRLGNTVDRVTRHDMLYPLLTEEHLNALDRRLDLVLATVQWCSKQRTGGDLVLLHAVLIDT